MTDYKKLLESNMKIRFHDCDPFNHLNNSRYIDYLMTARGDQLIDEYGLDIYQLAQEQGIGWVTAQTQISYLIPAFLMEEVAIQTRLLRHTEKSLVFEASMWSADKQLLKAVMWVKLVHYNLRTQKSHQHTDELMRFFSEIVYPLVPDLSFDERVKELKQGLSI